MKFTHGDFVCDVDMFRNKDDIVLRFYDATKEYGISDYTCVDSGYGFLCLKIKDKDGMGIVSGYLNVDVFSNDNIILEAIEFLEKQSIANDYCNPYRVECVKLGAFVDYTGETNTTLDGKRS
ncbi:MAG: hypothetical protein FWC89_04610 [Defluviitaleaceae bacterium]|nr:hypothetical protein [Defluviitaleaceae bacterium]